MLATKREDKPADTILKLSDGAVHQLKWWLSALISCQSGAPIPDIRGWAWVEGLDLHSDASGGAPGAGMGGVALQWKTDQSKLPWCREEWPSWINNKKKSETCGLKMHQKLTALEGAAALATLWMAAEEATGKTVYMFVDNSGFVFAMAKGHSRCLLANSLAKSVYDLGKALGSNIIVTKQPRCSDGASLCADALSKGDIDAARGFMDGKLEKNKRVVSRSLMMWLRDPVPDPALGSKMAAELRSKMSVLDWGEPVMSLAERKSCFFTRRAEDKRLGPRPRDRKKEGQKRKGAATRSRAKRMRTEK